MKELTLNQLKAICGGDGDGGIVDETDVELAIEKIERA